MRIAVTGRHGQLSRALQERGAALGHEIFPIARPVLDLAACDDHAMYPAFAQLVPDAIVNAAAYTAVDLAESEPELAFSINAGGAGAVARAATRLGVPLVHVSTDYVFPGDKAEPYVESDSTGPTGVYGASKLAGEDLVLASGEDVAILRTSWVYSPFGANFAKTMLRLASTRDKIGVVHDQHGCPTSGLDLADAVIAVAANLAADPDPKFRGLFHAAGGGEASWYEFARAIFVDANAVGGPAAEVDPITTRQFPTPARRPANSRLDCSKLAEVHGVRLPDWRNSSRAVVARLVRENGYMA